MTGERQTDLVRHLLATLAYRGGKALRGAPDSFGEFRVGDSGWAAIGIASHLGDLLDWSAEIAGGGKAWRTATPGTWAEETARFHAALEKLDARFAGGDVPAETVERLIQGPIADALTHVGQLAMLRRLAGIPTAGENYFQADVRAGRLGADQPEPVAPFKK